MSSARVHVDVLNVAIISIDSAIPWEKLHVLTLAATYATLSWQNIFHTFLKAITLQ